MNAHKTTLPLVKLPSECQISLYLITEELKSRKFFATLQQIGLDDCYFQPHLDSLIMNSMGIDDGTDETFAIFDEILEKRSHKIEADNDSIMKQALKVYYELVELRKKLNATRRDNQIR